MIDSKDITFVLQGTNVKDKTNKSMKLIRKNFPHSKIIFSTYVDEDTTGLDFDDVIKSQDPGAIKINDNFFDQINRILKTTQAGLNEVKTKYCVKMRSDLFIMNNGILKDFNSKFPKRNPEYSICEQRVVFFQLWTRLSYKLFDFEYTPFYFSDWFCFGLTEDIKKIYFEAQPVQEKDFYKYFADRDFIQRFDTEQYIGSCFCKKYFKEAEMIDCRDYTQEKADLSNKILANNFIICNFNQIGIYLDKKPYNKLCKKNYFDENDNWINGICSHLDFLNLYKKYCDLDYVIPPEYNWQEVLKLKKYKQKLNKHYKKFINSVKSFADSICSLIGVVYYFLHILINAIRFLPKLIYNFIKSR